MDMIIGRSHTPLNSSTTIGSVRRRDDNSRGKVQNVRGDSSAEGTGHRSRELERYQHLTPELRALTVNLIATELFRGKRARKERESGTPTGTVRFISWLTEPAFGWDHQIQCKFGEAHARHCQRHSIAQ